MSDYEKMLAGEMYDASAPALVVARARAQRLCLELAAPGLGPDERRRLQAELFGAGGEGAFVTPPFHCDYGSHIALGERVYFNANCVVLDVCRVTIGAFTLLGPAVHVYTALHPMDAARRRVEEYGRPVEIGADVWIGGAALILPGVRIGDRAVIGAGSVVTRDVPAGGVAVGNPARLRG